MLKSSVEVIPSVCLTDPFLPKISWREKSETLPLEVHAHRQQNIDWAMGKICRLLHLGCLGHLMSHPSSPGAGDWLPCLPCTVPVAVGLPSYPSWCANAPRADELAQVCWAVHVHQDLGGFQAALGPLRYSVKQMTACLVRLQRQRDAPDNGLSSGRSPPDFRVTPYGCGRRPAPMEHVIAWCVFGMPKVPDTGSVGDRLLHWCSHQVALSPWGHLK